MSSQSRLYLTFDVAGDGANAETALRAALKAAPVACVLLRGADGGALAPALAKALVKIVQDQGIAVLIGDDAGLARMVKADGLHLAWSKAPIAAYREARDILGKHAMIGADAGRSRHDAMELGEAGADYVAFGIPAHVEDRETAEERQLDLVSWWSEIFEVPAVAFDVAHEAHAAALARAGADFVTAGVATTMTEDEITSRLRAAGEAIANAGVAA